MAVTRTTLIADFPEFTGADSTMVTAKIAIATARVNSSVLGDQHDNAVTLLSCHLIATSPYNRDQRMSFGDADSYYAEYLELIRPAGHLTRLTP